MNHLYCLGAAFLLSVSACPAQTTPADSAANAANLLGIEQKLLDGIGTGDTLLWNQYLAPDFLIVNEDGSRGNKMSYLNELKPLPAGVSGHINITNPHFHFAGTMAVLNYVADEYENYFGNAL